MIQKQPFSSNKFCPTKFKKYFLDRWRSSKENDRIILNKAKRNIAKSYIIGKNIKFLRDN